MGKETEVLGSEVYLVSLSTSSQATGFMNSRPACNPLASVFPVNVKVGKKA